MKKLYYASVALTVVAISACLNTGLMTDLTEQDSTVSSGGGGGGGGGGSSPITVTGCSDVSPSFNTGQNASVVIGQSSFTSGTANAGGALGAVGIFNAYGKGTVRNGALFVSDYQNNRILGFNAIPTSNGSSANFAVGQASLTSNASGMSATGIANPQGVLSHENKLLVLDYGNSRILIYNTAPTSSGAAADVVIGTPDLTTASSNNCDAKELASPESFAIVGNKLLVADSNHHRILVWNSIPTSNYASADLVIGQADFTTCDDPDGGAGPGADNISYPTDVTSDGTKIAVVDYNRNRVLIWNSTPTSNGAAANVVLGQEDFTTVDANAGGISASSLNTPYGVLMHKGSLYVADTSNHRVLIWNSIPTSTHTAADVVLGQTNFTSSSSGITQSKLKYPNNMFICGNQLFVTDGSSSRYLIFEGQ